MAVVGKNGGVDVMPTRAIRHVSHGRRGVPSSHFFLSSFPTLLVLYMHITSEQLRLSRYNNAIPAKNPRTMEEELQTRSNQQTPPRDTNINTRTPLCTRIWRTIRYDLTPWRYIKNDKQRNLFLPLFIPHERWSTRTKTRRMERRGITMAILLRRRPTTPLSDRKSRRRF